MFTSKRSPVWTVILMPLALLALAAVQLLYPAGVPAPAASPPAKILPVTAPTLAAPGSASFTTASLTQAGSAPSGSTIWLPLALKIQAASNPLNQGIATYYDATGEVACSFDLSPEDLMVAAMNAEQYDNAAACGAYVSVAGPKGQVTVRIVDLCPECRAGYLDLSREAFTRIAELEQGRVAITWQVVSPELSGPISYHFKDGSNQWWTAVQVRSHRNPVAKLEYLLESGQWVEVGRTAYNYFVQSNPGMGPGPYTFRVTDSYGHTLTDSGIPYVEGGQVSGAAQFPPGP